MTNPICRTPVTTRQTFAKHIQHIEPLESRTLLSSSPLIDAVHSTGAALHHAVTQPLRVVAKPKAAAASTSGTPSSATATATATSSLATLTLKPLDLRLLGLEVKTSPITITLSAQPGGGQLLGNLLNATSSLVNLQQASTALNRVLASTVNLLNSSSMTVSGIVKKGALNSAAAATLPVVNVSVAPVHLNLLGVDVDTTPIQLSIIAHSGKGLILGNAAADLANLFNPPLPNTISIATIDTKLEQLLSELKLQAPGITAAQVPTVVATPGQVVSLTVPPINLNLLGLGLQTSPITVNADAQTGNGLLLGNVLTTALNTLNATPQDLANLSNDLNGVLGEVVGVLNATRLSLPAGAVGSLPQIVQRLVRPTLTASAGSSTQVLNLIIDSSDGTTPPVNVNLLGLNVTTSNIDATLTATTGGGQVLGNLLYNLANLANPNGASALLHLFDQLGAGASSFGGNLSGLRSSTIQATPAQQLLQINLKPLNVDLLGLDVTTSPITVTISTQQGSGQLLGNLLTGVTTLLNVPALNTAVNNVLGNVINLVNSASLAVTGVGTGTLTTAQPSTTQVLNLVVAPVHLNLLGLLVDTSPIQVTISAHAGDGLVLGNVVTDLANLFNPPLPTTLSLGDINARLQQLLTELNQQIPGITPAPVQPVTLGPGQLVSLTVPPIDLNLLGLVLNTSPITVNATDQTGNGDFLGNVLTTVLNTIGATPTDLTNLSNDLNAVLAKVVGVLNASTLSLPATAVSALPSVLQTLADPLLLNPTSPASSQVLDLTIASPTGDSTPPVDVNLLGLNVTTSNISAQLTAQTGDGQILGNLVYNVANLLNPGETLTLLTLVTQLGGLTT